MNPTTVFTSKGLNSGPRRTRVLRGLLVDPVVGVRRQAGALTRLEVHDVVADGPAVLREGGGLSFA